MPSSSPSPPPLLRIANFDIRFQIYSHLIPYNQEINLLSPLHPPTALLALLALSKTCRTTHAEISQWYKSQRKHLHNNLRAQFGIFHAPSARFILDIRDRVQLFENEPGEETLALDPPTENAWRHLALDPALHSAVRHLVIDGRLSDQYQDPQWPFYVLAEQIFPFLRRFQHLSSCEIRITAKQREEYKEGAWNAWTFETMDIWCAFWEIMMGMCSPGDCCTCCVLPELRVRVCDAEAGTEVVEILPGEVGEGFGDWYDLSGIRDG